MFIIETFRQVCRRYPQKVAVSGPAGDTSYAALARRVNGLAATLRKLNVGPGSRVAIHLERSVEMVVAILGTLSSGAAYVPLDPDNPAPRLRQIVEDSQPSLMLGRADGSELAQSARVPRLDPDEWEADATASDAPAGEAAYIIYTSGSTGRPKGVVVEHASLENYLAWALAELPFNGGGVPLFASISFDHAVTCFFPPLLKGEPLILLPPLQGGRALAPALLGGRHYSYVKITPSHARLLSPDQRAELGLRTDLLMFGGERVSPELISQVRRDNPGLVVINHYGPTEATVGCCVYRVPANIDAPANVPIGRPIPGVETIIRLEDGKSAGSGEVGELLVGGKAPASGYWGQPELTAKSFIELPGGQVEGARWYRTGDLVRRLGDGNLEFLGRADGQIKVLGHRIELAEIERALLSHTNVREAAALAAGTNDSPEIVAAVTTSDATLSEEALRQYLRSQLPSAMVPSRISFFETLPVKSSGKIDREAILDRSQRRVSEAPEMAVEDLLAAKFREALGVPDVRLDDDFFELGGDSMAAVEIVTWGSEHFQIPLETPALFEYPTIQTLAARIRSLMLACPR
jgi:amino acid adenylation domain-containing protein